MDTPTAFHAIETQIYAVVQWIRLSVEGLGVAVIALGVLFGIFRFGRAVLMRATEDYSHIRLTLAQYLAVGLEFQLASDILSTAVAPSWDQIGKLGVIAVIRTGLNYFLTREMEVRK